MWFSDCWMFSSICGFYSLDTSNTYPSVVTPGMSPDIYKCPVGTKLSLVDNYHYCIWKVEEMIWTLVINITIFFDGRVSPYFRSLIIQKYKYFFFFNNTVYRKDYKQWWLEVWFPECRNVTYNCGETEEITDDVSPKTKYHPVKKFHKIFSNPLGEEYTTSQRVQIKNFILIITEI